VSRRVVAVAFTRVEVDVLLAGLALLEEHDGDRETTAPLRRLLERAVSLDDLGVRVALESFSDAVAPHGARGA
jgi:hypothetical protein